MNVMRGSARGERERIIALAHLTEVMARQKVLEPLGKYLAPPPKRQTNGAAVVAMMRRFQKRKG